MYRSFPFKFGNSPNNHKKHCLPTGPYGGKHHHVITLTPGIWDYRNRMNVNTGLTEQLILALDLNVFNIFNSALNKQFFFSLYFSPTHAYRFPQQPEEGAAENVVLYPPQESENDALQVDIYVFVPR